MKRTLEPEQPGSVPGIAASGIASGSAAPLGATITATGTNFSVFSKYETGIELLLFDRVDDRRPARVIPIDSVTNRQRLAAQQAFPFLNLLEMRAYSTVECIAMALPALKQAQLSPQAPAFCHPNTSPPP